MVTPTIRAAVLTRDGFMCRAPFLDTTTDPCRDRWGDAVVIGTRAYHDALTLDHVQSSGGRMGKRAPSDPAHLVTLCWHHHLNGWATSHRPMLREYLTRTEGPDDADHD
jgi:hypothetical protein